MQKALWPFSPAFSPRSQGRKTAAQIDLAIWSEARHRGCRTQVHFTAWAGLAWQVNNTVIVLRYSVVPTGSQPLWLSSRGFWNVFQNVLKSDCLISARLRKIYYVAQNSKPNK